MSKELETVLFNELKSIKNIENKEYINIDKNGVIKKYRVINTIEELLKSPLNLSKDLGILVTCECKNICEYNDIYKVYCNTIFLKSVVIDYMFSKQLDEFQILTFEECDFFEKVEFVGGKYQNILIRSSRFKNKFSVMYVKTNNFNDINNIFEKEASIKESSIHHINIDASIINENFSFEKVNISNDCIIDKIIIKNKLKFSDCRFEGVSKFNKLQIERRGELNLSHCSFYKISEINFDKILGKLSIYKTNFADKCYLEYEQLESKGYEPLFSRNDLKKTKWNFFYVADIYKSNGKTEQYLETFYYFKKYERLEKKSNNKWSIYLLDYLVEITTKYYTSWKRTLLSMGIMIIIFFLIYCSFPNLLIYKDTPISSKNLFVLVFDMIKNSNIDMYCLISKFGNVLYFTIITFTTVGYGDITPLNWMKAVAGLEALLGIFYTSSFVVALSRKFLG